MRFEALSDNRKADETGWRHGFDRDGLTSSGSTVVVGGAR